MDPCVTKLRDGSIGIVDVRYKVEARWVSRTRGGNSRRGGARILGKRVACLRICQDFLAVRGSEVVGPYTVQQQITKSQPWLAPYSLLSVERVEDFSHSKASVRLSNDLHNISLQRLCSEP